MAQYLHVRSWKVCAQNKHCVQAVFNNAKHCINLIKKKIVPCEYGETYTFVHWVH